MKKLTQAQTEALRADQDYAAAMFWGYPDRAWQIGFQADWLQRQYGTDRATGPDGLVYGAYDRDPAAVAKSYRALRQCPTIPAQDALELARYWESWRVDVLGVTHDTETGLWYARLCGTDPGSVEYERVIR